ncbi:hypothetical protein SAMN04244553_2744 [Nocardia amikacinitolerans]|uniref:Uncharacterized protein n=1 Tax=Nocardia amikacinitolerans TaxID=756689 RepID=A0A285LCN8_9NOCA|nr:hypothetical protein SAMN04244553_2744 [Nocardia amikacinitolerans]
MSNDLCAECGRRGIPILYGMPAPSARALAAAGLISLGGCVVVAGNPDWSCRACGHLWSDPEGAARALKLIFQRLLDPADRTEAR